MRRFAATLAILSAFGGPASAATASIPPKDGPAVHAFVRPDLASESVRLKAAVQRSFVGKGEGRSADDLAAAGDAQAKDPGAALADYGAAIAAGRDDAAVWADFAGTVDRAAGATKDADLKTKLAGWALPAAYRAYEKAAMRADEAAWLATLGRILADGERWRDALDAEKASLIAREDATVRAAYDKLREAHGFRITDYKIDADAATPRICVLVSEDIAASAVDLAGFVVLDGRSGPALTVEARQICVEGLAHGQSYHLSIRRGLPSTVGEDLPNTADYDVFVPDRPARIAFAGRNYVLPRTGAEGIPLLSVNVDTVDVSILHIGDRNLVNAVRNGEFRDQIGTYGLRRLAGDEGRTVWTGTLAIASRLNEDVRTAFPVRDALGALGPGVYVMQAHVHAADTDDEGAGGDGRNATQWFVVSDLGLTTFTGDGGITALVRSLATARPMAGVAVKLLARDNEVLDTRVTDADGAVRFDPGVSRGAGGDRPAVLTAVAPDGDGDFLDLDAASFDLTDRGNKGRAAAGGPDAFVYAERGVYRSGETVYLTALLRDAAGVALPGVPLTFVVSRPDGVENRRILVPDAGLGGHVVALPLLAEAASGTWRVAAYADPKGAPVGETSFLVEDYLPERLSLVLRPASPQLRPGEAATVDATARFLYGAPGKGLDVSADCTVEAAAGPAWPALDGYQTGLTDEKVEPVTTHLETAAATGGEGTATVTVPVAMVPATRPLQARLAVRVGEPGGRAIERGVTLPILPATTLIGVRSASGSEGDGGSAVFDVVTVDAAGARSAVPDLRWRLFRTERNYQWYRDGDAGPWRFESVASTKLVADGVLSTSVATPARISAPVGFGRYRLDLSSAAPTALPPTSLGFDVGVAGDGTADSPDLLDVTLDRADYRPGDMLRATITSRFGGHATLVIGQGSVAARQEVELAVGDTVVTMPVDAAWGTGAYALAVAHRPLDVAAKRMPGRAIGLAWFAVDGAARNLGVTLDLPAMARPRATLRVPVKLTGLAPGEAADVTVSAVDVGILALTRYETPRPGPFFFGQRTLGLDMRDLYGALIDGLGVPGGAIHQGGDGGVDAEVPTPTQAPLARFSGIVPVGPDGTATVAFDIPAFNGTVRVSAVAWSKNRVGSTEADVVLRDPVVVTASLPRFLSIGDRARAHLDIDDVDGAAGAYRLEVTPRGPWFLPADALDRTVLIEAGTRTGIDIPLTAAGLGTAGLGLRLRGPDGLDVAQDVALTVAPGAPAVYRRDIHPLAPGQSLTVSKALLAEFVPGSGSVSLAVSPLGDIDVPALLLALDRYPVGCSEQIVSRALPLLYLDRFAPPKDLGMEGDLAPRIAAAVAQLLSRETAEGSFGLWTAASDTEDPWLDAYVADFLTRAKESGQTVPARALDPALDRLRNLVANGITDSSAGDPNRTLALGYAAYVLARNGRPVMADLRYLAAKRLDDLGSPLAKAQLGAALAMLGDRTRAATVFAAATAALARDKDDRDDRDDYGSKLRDAAAVLALASDAGADADAAKAGDLLTAAQHAPYPLSTQEEAWLVLAALAVETRAKGLALTVDGVAHAGPFYRQIASARLDGGTVTLANAGPSPIDVVVTTSGQLPSPEPAADRGYAIERHYYRLDGREADVSQVTQNERLAVVLKVTESTATRARLLLTDRLPAGFEIDNPALVADGAIPGLPGLDVDAKATHTAFRDDRFTATFDRTAQDPAFFSLAYMVRAVTPGRFVHPPAVIEDMYRPERFGRTGNGTVEVRAAR